MSLRPEDLLTHSDDNSFRTKLTGMSLNTKSGVSRGVKIRRSQYELTFNVGRRLLRRLPTDVKKLVKAISNIHTARKGFFIKRNFLHCNLAFFRYELSNGRT